jgi:hypothetical protein
MVKANRFFLLAILLAALVSFPLLAANPTYERSTEVTLDGSALYVAEAPPLGLFAIMKDGQGEIQVFFGPSQFVAQEGVQPQTGDSIKVVGSRVKWDGTEIILAREVTRNGKTASLRTKDGAPRW